MLKRYTEYSKEELSSVTDEEFEKLVNIECMIQGIPVPYLKVVHVDVPIVPEPDKEVYKIEGIPQYLSDPEEACELVEIIRGLTSVVQLDYDYNYGVERKYVKKVEGAIVRPVIVKAYSKEAYKNAKSFIEAEKIAKQRNQEIDSENYTDKIYEIQQEVREAIREAAYENAKYENAKALYKEYLRLSDGNEEIANSFFEKSDASDYLDRILIDMKKGNMQDAGEPDAD